MPARLHLLNGHLSHCWRWMADVWLAVAMSSAVLQAADWDRWHGDGADAVVCTTVKHSRER